MHEQRQGRGTCAHCGVDRPSHRPDRRTAGRSHEGGNQHHPRFDSPKLPIWKRGGDIENYSVQTLLFIAEGAAKTGVRVPQFKYAVYAGDPTRSIDCGNSYLDGQRASQTYPLVFCPELNGEKNVFLLVSASKFWANDTFWSHEFIAPLYYMVQDMAELVARLYSDIHAEPTLHNCMIGQLYWGLVLRPGASPEPSYRLAFIQKHPHRAGVFLLSQTVY